MRLGLRGKLVTLLAVVGLLPLVVATVTIVVGFRSLRIESFGRKLSSAAAAEARIMQVSLTKDAGKLLLLLNENAVVAQVAAHTDQLSAAERARRDADWPERPDSDPAVRKVLNNPLADLLRLIREDDRRIAELLMTDRYGQLIAATGRTSDFYQADEQWWQQAFADGAGRLFIPAVNYDRSGAVWSIDVCVPIRQGDRVVGVTKAVLDVTGWIGSDTRNVGAFSAFVMLVGEDGKVIFRPGAEPLATSVESHTQRGVDASATGWWQTEDGQIQAGAAIRLPGRIGFSAVEAPTWVLVLFISRSGPLGPVNRLSLIALVVGLAIVGVIFLVGLFLADRSIARRISRLGHATRRVAGGDLAHRVGPDWPTRRLLGRDEIDDLATDFNQMMGRVQHSYDQLQAANELKSRFIKIASHELRTPVSYILGMADLLKENDDPKRLHQGMLYVGERARRLNEIILAMFKLLPEQAYGEELRYSTVRIAELLEAVRADCAPFVEQRAQRLVIETTESVPAVQGDWGMLRDVVESLVMNAIKFTPDGGVVEVSAGRELGGRVSIAVKDQGPGIPKPDLPHIFEPFYSGGEVFEHSSGRSGYKKRGMGLGLAIVRHFLQLHAGTVNVSSSESGAVFTVTIPVEPPPREQRPEQPGR